MDNQKALELLDSKEAYESAIEALHEENESLKAMLRDNPTHAEMDAAQFLINYLQSVVWKLRTILDKAIDEMATTISPDEQRRIDILNECEAALRDTETTAGH